MFEQSTNIFVLVSEWSWLRRTSIGWERKLRRSCSLTPRNSGESKISWLFPLQCSIYLFLFEISFDSVQLEAKETQAIAEYVAVYYLTLLSLYNLASCLQLWPLHLSSSSNLSLHFSGKAFGIDGFIKKTHKKIENELQVYENIRCLRFNKRTDQEYVLCIRLLVCEFINLIFFLHIYL